MTHQTIVLVDEAEARALVDEIRAGMDGIRERVFRLYEGEGWRALGYSSWRACVKAEFPLSERRMYQELTAAKVEVNLNHGSHEPVQLNERQARELAKLPEEQQSGAWNEAVETAPDGKVTAKHVADVVRRRLPQSPTTARSAPRRRLASPPAEDALSRIRKQRHDDPSLAQWIRTQVNIEREMIPSPEMRKVLFILQDGEQALLRLGLDWSVTAEKLKQAYRDAVRVAHPDKGGSPEEFRIVQRDRELVAQMLGEEVAR